MKAVSNGPCTAHGWDRYDDPWPQPPPEYEERFPSEVSVRPGSCVRTFLDVTAVSVSPEPSFKLVVFLLRHRAIHSHLESSDTLEERLKGTTTLKVRQRK